jgi:ribonuclease P protein component
MIKSRDHLLTKEDFLQIKKCGIIIKTKNCIIKFIEFKKNSNLKFGLTISKKIGNSVTRNKIKRQFRHITSDFTKEKSLKNYKIVFYARKLTPTSNFKTIEKDLTYALNKISNAS